MFSLVSIQESIVAPGQNENDGIEGRVSISLQRIQVWVAIRDPPVLSTPVPADVAWTAMVAVSAESLNTQDAVAGITGLLVSGSQLLFIAI